MSAVRRPLALENFHIFTKGQCENTFKICLLQAKAVSTAKIENIFPTNKHSAGYCGQKSALSFDCRLLLFYG